MFIKKSLLIACLLTSGSAFAASAAVTCETPTATQPIAKSSIATFTKQVSKQLNKHKNTIIGVLATAGGCYALINNQSIAAMTDSKFADEYRSTAGRVNYISVNNRLGVALAVLGQMWTILQPLR
ncbi:MAG TPA: hypothetical protein VLG71_03120 [Candidatus Limnocylindria bacterium]|nr:hypothetical protein [Candidatus Limnocylindria bacterium]